MAFLALRAVKGLNAAAAAGGSVFAGLKRTAHFA